MYIPQNFLPRSRQKLLRSAPGQSFPAVAVMPLAAKVLKKVMVNKLGLLKSRSMWETGNQYPDQFLPLQRDMIGKFGAAKDQWFSSFLLQVENHSSWHRLFVDPLSRAMYSSDGPDFEFVQQKRKEGLSIHEAVWQLAWKKSGPEMASLEAWLEEHEKYRSVA